MLLSADPLPHHPHIV
ncbi:MAG: hypothetical protein ACI4SZ_03355 [Lachnospiraceae bacterium]